MKWHTAELANYKLLKQNAKSNRKAMTEAESAFWSYVKRNALGQRCRKQYIIGEYIVDFFFRESMLIIEIDGGYHSTPEQVKADAIRQDWLQQQGYQILRFSNEQILFDIENSINIVKQHIL